MPPAGNPIAHAPSVRTKALLIAYNERCADLIRG
jgi:hypothetical protein